MKPSEVSEMLPSQEVMKEIIDDAVRNEGFNVNKIAEHILDVLVAHIADEDEDDVETGV